MEIALVDIGISNVASVAEAFRRIGAAVSLTADEAKLRKADAIVLPGVGAFGDGMASLRDKRLVAPIQAAVRAGTPILGFCLGMQLMAEQSEEMGRHEGLGLLRAKVVRLAAAPGERVPNMGWCDVAARQDSRLFRGIPQQTSLYFAHSYHVACAQPEDASATIAFGDGRVTAAIEAGNIFGLQAHPEKSQDAGLTVLSNFVASVRARAA